MDAAGGGRLIYYDFGMMVSTHSFQCSPRTEQEFRFQICEGSGVFAPARAELCIAPDVAPCCLQGVIPSDIRAGLLELFYGVYQKDPDK